MVRKLLIVVALLVLAGAAAVGGAALNQNNPISPKDLKIVAVVKAVNSESVSVART